LISNIKFFQNKIQKNLSLSSDEKRLKTLKAKIPVNKAGGGLVYNKNGEVLFIFRNGKWVTKGGTEKVKISRAHQCAR
jgi:TATA-box binding protein (TBP) (component of TFIID and TFIIIB)